MRATINFDVDVNRVEETMSALVLQEVDTLHIAIEILETTSPDSLFADITKSLEHLDEATRQLQQYRSMIMAFEKARYETILPQPSDVNMELTQAMESEAPPVLGNFSQVEEALNTIQNFESFMGQVGEPEPEPPTDEASEDNEEG